MPFASNRAAKSREKQTTTMTKQINRMNKSFRCVFIYCAFTSIFTLSSTDDDGAKHIVRLLQVNNGIVILRFDTYKINILQIQDEMSPP